MVFGLSARERGKAAVVGALKPIFASMASMAEPPTRTQLHSPYIIGFLTTLFGFLAKLAIGEKARGETAGWIILTAWIELTGDPAEELGSEMIALASVKQAKFEEGADNAMKFVHVVHGKPNLSDPEVAAAVDLGKKVSRDLEFLFKPGENRNAYGGAAGVLWQKWFIARLSGA